MVLLSLLFCCCCSAALRRSIAWNHCFDSWVAVGGTRWFGWLGFRESACVAIIKVEDRVVVFLDGCGLAQGSRIAARAALWLSRSLIQDESTDE